MISIDQGEAVFILDDIPVGTYSAVIYHDINANGQLDRHVFGLPKEPYGFSNNARSMVGIPSFSDAYFQVNPNHNLQKITIK